MPDPIALRINGALLTVAPGTTVAAAMLIAGAPCRTSVSGQPRAALCGMGICFECRATINGVAQQRTCQLLCASGMAVESQP